MVRLIYTGGSLNQSVSSDRELRESIYWDLVESKRAIEQQLSGSEVTQLCYPYYVGSEVAIEMSKEAGYLCDRWCFLDKKLSHQLGDDPYRVVRLSEEFIFRLPGDGRTSLSELIFEHFAKNDRRFLGYIIK